MVENVNNPYSLQELKDIVWSESARVWRWHKSCIMCWVIFLEHTRPA